MPKIQFEGRDGEKLEVQVEGAESLMDICDKLDAPIPFSCRAASCGTCCVLVQEGQALLEPPELDERQLLSDFGLDKSHRFACVACVAAGEGTLSLKAVEPD